MLKARPNISETAADAVRDMIVSGALRDGARINEVKLAEKLGLSRTPLREALNRLASEGALIARPRLGLFVRPLTVEEFDQIYDIRPILDPEALRLAGIPAPERIAKLEKLNAKLQAARNPRAAIALDDEWHFELIRDCPNRVLLDLIHNITLRTRRYELALMRETTNVMTASDEHARIIAALRDKDLKAACAALKRNMQSGKAPILAWLKTRTAQRNRSIDT